ncbi:MAG: hypothetical protein HY550_01790 [Elusimicrobia bacterium]|nr:hypothetical protein [Elusimicrobiota bacterium]
MEEIKKDCCQKKHMCDLMADKNAFEAVKEAAKDAQFICTACGRSAKTEDSLCVPVKL